MSDPSWTDEWACSRCTFLNAGRSINCEMCDAAAPILGTGLDSMSSRDRNSLQEGLTTCVEGEQALPMEMASFQPEDAAAAPQEEPDSDTEQLRQYCASIEFPPNRPSSEAQGYEELWDHLRTAYPLKSYFEILAASPKVACSLYQRYFAMVSPSSSLSHITALKAWDTLGLKRVFKSYALWEEFLNLQTPTISRDVWNMVWAFAAVEDEALAGYSMTEAWPTLIDEFVEWKFKKEGRTSGPAGDSVGSGSPSVFAPSSSPTFNNQTWASSLISSSFNFGNIGGPRTGYRGLYNQGATCYMNSLLQTLFMTPEFRRSLYRWQGGKTLSSQEEAESIPLQLQRLFARLQFGESSTAVSTQALTQSFGWDSGQSFIQHDVQELCRVLFDVIEEHFAGTSEEHVIQDLYQGRVKDYVQCTECGYESSRSDKFLDISLDIHGVTTIGEALDKFVTPEILSGTSRWKCPTCDRPVDARKGLKIVELPYILMLQLKRFDYSPDLDYRVKLNHRVEFPFRVSLDKYIDESFEPEAITHPESEGQQHVEPLQKKRLEVGERLAELEQVLRNCSTQLLIEVYQSEIEKLREALRALDAEEASEAKGKEMAKDDDSNNDNGDDTGESTATTTATTKKRKGDDAETKRPDGGDEKKGRPSPAGDQIDERRQQEYELYSVLIHSGSAVGGHYYAYIKSFEKDKWYEFNDSLVTEIEVDKIEQAFGSTSSTATSSSWGCSAYMLCYRRVDPERNIQVVPTEEVDEELRSIKDVDTFSSAWSWPASDYKFNAPITNRWTRPVHNNSSDDEADNEYGGSSDMEVEGDAGEWDEQLQEVESDVRVDNDNNAVEAGGTATATATTTTAEVITENEDLELVMFLKPLGADVANEEPSIVRVSSNFTWAELIRKLRRWYRAEGCFAGASEPVLQLSLYHPTTQLVAKPFGFADELRTLRDLHVTAATPLFLEIKERMYSGWDLQPSYAYAFLVSEAVPTSSDEVTTEGVATTSCAFCTPQYVFTERRATLLDLKQAIHRELGAHLPPERQRIILGGTFTTEDLGLAQDSALLSSLALTDHEMLYVELCDDFTAPSPAYKQLSSQRFGFFSGFNFANNTSGTSSSTTPSLLLDPSFTSSTSSTTSSATSSTSSYRPKEKGVQIRRRADRPSSTTTPDASGASSTAQAPETDAQPPPLL